MSIKRFTAEKARTRMSRSKKKKLKILTDHLWKRINRAVESGKFRAETNGYFYDEGGTIPAELENQGEELMEELCQLAKEEFEKYGYKVVVETYKDCSKYCKLFRIKIDWEDPTKEASDEDKV